MSKLKTIDVVKSNPDLLKRFERAKRSDLTPLNVSTEKSSGRFSGSHGIYDTTLNDCSCYDYVSRLSPCKHMFRLAMELGLYDVDFSTDPSHIKKATPNKHNALIDAIGIIETRPEYLTIVKEIMYCHNTKRDYICFDFNELSFLLDHNLVSTEVDGSKIIGAAGQKKTIDALEANQFSFDSSLKFRKDKFQWCLQNADIICSIAFPMARLIVPCGLLLDSPKKIYSYLLRRTHTSENSVNWVTGELSADDLYNVDCDVVELLQKYDEYYKTVTYEQKAYENILQGVLSNYTIVLTGIFKNYTRDELSSLIQKNGGKVSGLVSRNTTFLVVGDTPGSKLNKARKLGVKTITEHDLLEMILQ